MIADLVSLFNEYGVRATFFVTHGNVTIPGHERAIHPNFRKGGDSYRSLPDAANRGDQEIFEHIVSTTCSFVPEAKGVRAHSLHYDSALLPIYRRHGIEYECSQRLPLVAGLRPFWNQCDIVGIPSYYSDYFDLLTGSSRFELERLKLDVPGLKVMDFHPNIVFSNFADHDSYEASRPFYHDPEQLLAGRNSGPGVRSLLIAALEDVTKRNRTVMTLGELNALWRSQVSPPWEDPL